MLRSNNATSKLNTYISLKDMWCRSPPKKKTSLSIKMALCPSRAQGFLPRTRLVIVVKGCVNFEVVVLEKSPLRVLFRVYAVARLWPMMSRKFFIAWELG